MRAVWNQMSDVASGPDVVLQQVQPVRELQACPGGHPIRSVGQSKGIHSEAKQFLGWVSNPGFLRGQRKTGILDNTKDHPQVFQVISKVVRENHDIIDVGT